MGKEEYNDAYSNEAESSKLDQFSILPAIDAHDTSNDTVILRLTAALLARWSDCRAGGRWFRPRPDQHEGSLNNSRESAFTNG